MTTPPTTEATTWVIGHRNPDTDAICSAIGYADYLQRTRLPGARAACCGEINERTVWALERAGVSAPPLLMNVRPTAASICRKDPVTATADESFLTVYERLTAGGFRSLPVVDENRQVVGVPKSCGPAPVTPADRRRGGQRRRCAGNPRFSQRYRECPRGHD